MESEEQIAQDHLHSITSTEKRKEGWDYLKKAETWAAESKSTFLASVNQDVRNCVESLLFTSVLPPSGN